jgi:hypothetical protein
VPTLKVMSPACTLTGLKSGEKRSAVTGELAWNMDAAEFVALMLPELDCEHKQHTQISQGCAVQVEEEGSAPSR